MPDPSEGLSVSDNRQTQLNAEQARQALRRLLDTTNPDPMDVVALDRIINPRKYNRDMDIFGFGGLGSMLGFSHTEMRMVNNSSEEGVLHQRSFTIWLEKLDGNQEYQQIEAKLDEMRQTAQKDPNYKLSGNPEFDQLYQKRQDIQDGLKIIAQHQAERELGITDATARREIGSGEHLLKAHPELDFGKRDDLVSRAYIDAALATSTTTNSEGQALSTELSQQLTEARQALTSAVENLDRLKANPSTDPVTLAASRTQTSFAHNVLSDLQHQNKVYPDYSNIFDAEQKQRELDAQRQGGLETGRAVPAIQKTGASAFDQLDRGAVVAQGDKGMIAELTALGSVPAGLANDPDALSGGARFDNGVTLQNPRM